VHGFQIYTSICDLYCNLFSLFSSYYIYVLFDTFKLLAIAKMVEIIFAGNFNAQGQLKSYHSFSPNAVWKLD
jgi:hypothetical protein